MTPPLTMKIYLEKGHKVVETHSILAFFPSRNISVLVGKTNSQKIGDFRKLLSNIELRDPAGDIPLCGSKYQKNCIVRQKKDIDRKSDNIHPHQ